MEELLRATFVAHNCNNKCGSRKEEKLEAKATCLAGANTHCGIAILFPT